MKKRNFYSQKFAQNLGHCQRLEKVKKNFENYHFKRILDVGCGDGSFSKKLGNSSVTIYGIEIAKKAVEKARQKGIKAFRINVDNQSLPFKTAFFEAVYCGEILEHLFDPDHLLSEVHRVLKTKGTLVITTPNLSWWLNRLVLLLGFQPYLTEVSLRHNVGKFQAKPNDISGHIRSFTHKALKELLKLHHFKILKSLGNSVGKSLPLPVSLVENLFSLIPSLSHSNIIISEKRGK